MLGFGSKVIRGPPGLPGPPGPPGPPGISSTGSVGPDEAPGLPVKAIFFDRYLKKLS